jgi:hypothetical protein
MNHERKIILTAMIIGVLFFSPGIIAVWVDNLIVKIFGSLWIIIGSAIGFAVFNETTENDNRQKQLINQLMNKLIIKNVSVVKDL